MFRRLSGKCLCAAVGLSGKVVDTVLPNGTRLKGILNPRCPDRLLEGVTTLPDGREFNGNYDAINGHPLKGSRLCEDGDVYEGEFNNSWQREGLGKARLADGTCYEGKFEQDELVEGVVTIPQGTTEVVFKGKLQNETFLRGVLTTPDYRYEGDLLNNEPDGVGKLIFATGEMQEGTFRCGKLHGANCKLKLNGGFVYVGEFVDGHIRYGILYTPTYRYEGEFNEHLRAHGQGVQTYLVHEPRLVFTGIWNSGAMTQGTVVDEYGTPVEWQDAYHTQCQVLGDGDEALGRERVAMNGYCSAKLKEADELHHSVTQSYVEDADKVQHATGTRPSRMDLGYEAGIATEKSAAHQAAQKQLRDMESYRSSCQAREDGQHGAVLDNERAEEEQSSPSDAERMTFTRELGTQELSAQRADEQLSRFLRSFDNRKGSSVLDEEEVCDSPKLSINANATWKSYIPEGQQ